MLTLFYGGNGKPNYDDASSVADAEAALAKAKVSTKIMIDTSHANSNKDPYLQPLVLKNITEQILDGNGIYRRYHGGKSFKRWSSGYS